MWETMMGPLWLNLIGKKCNFAYCRSLENAISNKTKVLREAPKQAHLRLENEKCFSDEKHLIHTSKIT